MSRVAAVTVSAAEPGDAVLANLSTRAVTQPGDGVLIPGFVLSGTGSKSLLMRVIGPTLGGFGVEGTLADPSMTLKRSEGAAVVDVAANDDWDAQVIAAAADQLGAFPLGAGSADAALFELLEPGAYTIVAEGTDGASGVVLVELYDADPGGGGVGLVNLSARTIVGAVGAAPIPGFVISGDGPRTVLVRAVGPTLGDFGVSGTLPDPQLTIYSGSTALFGNNDWNSSADIMGTAVMTDLVGAFPLAAGSKDAALVVSLAPGAYTTVVSDAGGSEGIALVEVYLVP